MALNDPPIDASSVAALQRQNERRQWLLNKVADLRMWSRGERIAPHKPLLFLYALGQFLSGHRSISFEDVDRDLGRLLREFGPSSAKSVHTEYPFWRLQNDGLWEVRSDRAMGLRESNSDPRKSELKRANARGSFSADVIEALATERGIAQEVARRLLDLNFPETLHEDIASEVGLVLAATTRRRDPEFRRRVIRAYGARCCVCGYDLRIGSALLGLEAAHIKWFQAGGPDEETNGLALCALHHKIFDLGAFTVTPHELRIVLSQEIIGLGRFEWLLEFHGKPIARPQSSLYVPKDEYLLWHSVNVFKDPPREVGRR